MERKDKIFFYDGKNLCYYVLYYLRSLTYLTFFIIVYDIIHFDKNNILSMYLHNDMIYNCPI